MVVNVNATVLVAAATAATALVYVRHVAWRNSQLSNTDFGLLTLMLLLLLVWAASLNKMKMIADPYIDGPADFNITPFDKDAFQQLMNLPNEARTLIEPPLNTLITNAKGDNSNEADKPENLEPVAEADYEDAKDPYVGSVARVAKKDPVGNDVVEDVYTLDNDRFEKMKLEYKQLDAMLAMLRDVSPEHYKLFVESQPAGT